MSDRFNEQNAPSRGDSAYSRYSRSAGVTEYRRRRRARRILKGVTAIVLIAVIGGAAVLFGQHILEMPLFNGRLDLPSANLRESGEGQAHQNASLPEPVDIKLIAGGDVIVDGPALESGATESGDYDFSNLFAHITSELSGHDMRLVDQETNLPGDQYGIGSYGSLNAPQQLSKAEIAAGFNVILRANDHTLDNGREGLHDELAMWAREHPGTPLLGVAEPDPAANPGMSDYVNNIYMFRKDNFNVAVINHSLGINDGDRDVVSALTDEKITEDVERARDAGAQLIVACPHWGTENSTDVNDEQTHFAQVYADNGVDVILGSHPRMLQRAEVLTGENGHKTACFYSLGCLVSGLSDGDNLIGGLVELTLSRDNIGACKVTSAKLKPVVTHRADGGDYGTYLLKDYTEELAQSGWDANLTPEAVSQTCADIFGSDYQTDTDTLTLQL